MGALGSKNGQNSMLVVLQKKESKVVLRNGKGKVAAHENWF